MVHTAVVIVMIVAVLFVLPGLLVIMRVLALHGMAWNEVMHHSADDLNAQNSAEKAPDQYKACLLGGVSPVDQ